MATKDSICVAGMLLRYNEEIGGKLAKIVPAFKIRVINTSLKESGKIVFTVVL